MMNYARGILGRIFYPTCIAIKLRREACVPIELMSFPCMELEGMTIRMANAQACELLGENPVGRPFVALLDGDARKVWRRESTRRLASRIGYLGETRINCRKGQVPVRLMILRGRQRITLLMSAAEGQSVVTPCATSPLEALSSDALADLTHEMRTPLTIIRSAADLVRERPESCEQYLRGIERNCERLQRIVSDILALNTGRTCGYEPAQVELHSWLSDLVDSIRPQAQARAIALDVCAPEICIYTDACKLEHILLNLLSNALKFTPDGGHISVRVHEQCSAVKIIVRDDGCGIQPQELKRIFERGHTGDAQRGSGLGLALSARMAAELGGSLSASSDGMSGSEFTLELPCTAHYAGQPDAGALGQVALP